MRPIRFRAWDAIENEMFDVSAMDNTGSYDRIWEVQPDGERYFTPNATLMQFTGQYDKHGKEIYENDIVKLTCHTACSTDGSTSSGTISGIVEYDVVGFGLKRGMYFFPFASMYQVHDIEIIGNIYQEE